MTTRYEDYLAAEASIHMEMEATHAEIALNRMDIPEKRYSTCASCEGSGYSMHPNLICDACGGSGE